MINFDYDKTVALVADTLVKAGSTFKEDKKEAYRRAIAAERNEKAKWEPFWKMRKRRKRT